MSDHMMSVPKYLFTRITLTSAIVNESTGKLGERKNLPQGLGILFNVFNFPTLGALSPIKTIIV